jgi:hypothetical protein
MPRKQILPFLVGFLTLVLVLTFSSATLSQPLAAPPDDATLLTWPLPNPYAGATLLVIGPDGASWQREFAASEQPALSPTDAQGASLLDGQYSYEIRYIPIMSPAAAAAIQANRETADRGELLAELQAAGEISFAAPQSGTFAIKDGAFVVPELEQPSRSAPNAGNAPQAPQYFTHAEDVSIQGSLCTGLGCTGSEAFGADTIRLKENNLRIHFEDDSASAGFPANDWRIVINDQASGGANYFAVENSSSFVVPFKIASEAKANSLYVTSGIGSGTLPQIGVGTAAPVTTMHLVYANTPTLRLQQDNSQGWGDQTWDVAGNETNFFIRDVTGGSALPFKIQPGAATGSILIRNNGHIGIMPGTSTGGFPSIDTTLHVAAAAATFRVQNTTSGAITLDLDDGGNLTLNGLLTEASDRALKENVVPVDTPTVLEALATMPINIWNYISDSDGVRHMGPMAQDFYAAFGLGADDRHIAPLDANGVALAGVQELYGRLQAQEKEIEALEQENAALEQRLADLETAVSALLAAQGK